MDTYKACTYCREPIPHHRAWCNHYDYRQAAPEPAPAETSSEDSMKTDPQVQKQLHEAADKLMPFAKRLEAVRSLCGMQPLEFSLTVLTEQLVFMSGQIQSGMEQLTKSLSGSQASAPQPAPSSQASTAPAASDVAGQAGSHPRFSSEETLDRVARLEGRTKELQDQIHSLRKRLTSLEIDFQFHPPTSSMMRWADSSTPLVRKTAGSATTSSARPRSTSKRSKRSKQTATVRASSSAQKGRAKRGAT